jgi:hypothetical protein
LSPFLQLLFFFFLNLQQESLENLVAFFTTTSFFCFNFYLQQEPVENLVKDHNALVMQIACDKCF